MPPKNYLKSLLCWPTIQVAWGLDLSVINILSNTLLEKNSFLSQRLSIANGFLGIKLCIHFPFSELGSCLAQMCTGHVHTVTSSVCLHVYQLYCVWRTLFSWSYLPPLALTSLLPPLPHKFLSLGIRVLMKIRSYKPYNLVVCHSDRMLTGKFWVVNDSSSFLYLSLQSKFHLVTMFT